MRLEAVGGIEPPSHFASIQSISQTASALYLLSYTAYHICVSYPSSRLLEGAAVASVPPYHHVTQSRGVI